MAVISDQVREQTLRNGRLAALAGLPVTACPFDPARSAVMRALAHIWVRGHMAARPPTPGTLQFEQ